MSFILRVRRHPGAMLPNGLPYPWIDVWLLDAETPGTEGLMYGRVMPDKLQRLLDLFDALEGQATVEFMDCPLGGPATLDESCDKPVDQTLFDTIPGDDDGSDSPPADQGSSRPGQSRQGRWRK